MARARGAEAVRVPAPADPTEAADARWFVDEILAQVRRRHDFRALWEVYRKTLTGSVWKIRPHPQSTRLSWLARAFVSARHFRTIPIRPAPDFDEQAYLGRYSDVWRDVQSGEISGGFAHYVIYGRKEDRIRFRRQLPGQPQPARDAIAGRRPPVDAAAILAMLGDEAGSVSVLDTFRKPHIRLLLAYANILRKYSLFDDEFYRATYLRGGSGGVLPIHHYLAIGSQLGHRPNRFFDPLEYEALNPGTGTHGMDPVIHYALFGWRQGLRAGAHFDGEKYLDHYPDVRDAGIGPLQHFLTTGYRQARQPVPSGSRLPLSRADSDGAELSRFGVRNCGTIVVVTHDTNVGGAQHIAEMLASWLLASTKYAVKIVSMREGIRAADVARIAPVFDVETHTRRYDRETVKRMLQDFAGAEVKGILVNSVASAGFFDFWDKPTPTIAYIHELPKVIDRFGINIEKIKSRARHILAGSRPVREALCSAYGVDRDLCEVAWNFIEALPADGVSEDGRQKARQALKLGPKTFVVMGCGVVHARKGPEKFIEVAERVAAESQTALRFLWIGGGRDEDRCRALIKKKRLGDTVEILGFRDNVAELLKAADVFLLPSEEDPFPLVCLYAASARVPVICFEDAGGMPDFVKRGSGIAVPFQDVDAMAQAVLRYKSDKRLRTAHGKTGARLVRSRFTIRTAGPFILDRLRQVIGARPYVSVIVPNYNYGRFLPERIRSIRDQTFQDFEIILLDDASTDNSLDVLRRWADRLPSAKLIVNSENSGSPFAQWLKGMALARAEMIWLAEADDACAPSLLERLLPAFDDRNVFLGHVKSVPVNESGQIVGDHEKNYLDRIDPGRWTQAYTDTDHREINDALGIANSIPNASAVVLRRFDPEPDFVERISTMRMCGDWHFYQRALRGGRIAFSATPVNFHRRHEATLTTATQGSSRYFDELVTVRAATNTGYRLSPAARTRSDQFLEEDFERFNIGNSERDRVRADMAKVGATKKERPSLLVVTSDLSPGGGQMFAVRLANAWMQRGGRAFLLNAGHASDHGKVAAKLDSRVSLFRADDPDFALGRLIRDWDIDIIHSSLWWADKLIQSNSDQIPAHVPWLVTMHGCYETNILNPHVDASFPWRFEQMLGRVDQWIYTAEKNLEAFDRFGSPERLAKVENGYAAERPTRLDRSSLGLRSDSFVLCLASRAIASKGWRVAVEAVQRLNAAGGNVELLLIGDGPEADMLSRSGRPTGVVHVGQVDNLQDYIAVADAGLLPSTFVGESMPLVLLEFMAQGKPVVATDIGEIRSMIEGEDGKAGIVLPLMNDVLDAETLAQGIDRLMHDDSLKAAGQAARRRHTTRYTMDRMVSEYARIYDELLGNLPAHGE